jgi:hypothetical protein
VTQHEHAWTDDGPYRLHFTINGKVVRCYARRCRATDCQERALAPLDYCREHRALAHRLTGAP